MFSRNQLYPNSNVQYGRVNTGTMEIQLQKCRGGNIYIYTTYMYSFLKYIFRGTVHSKHASFYSSL